MLKRLREAIEALKKKPVSKTEAQKQEAMDKAIQDAGKLKGLINKPDTGWKEFVGLVEDYIKSIRMLKLRQRLDDADEKTVQFIKYLDREIYILEWMIQVPQQYINKVDEAVKEGNKNA